ncbi:MAG TPA: hypothetical protein VIW23_13975 [Candidatus Acidoferrum sp.]|jgi:hypothetical protein
MILLCLVVCAAPRSARAQAAAFDLTGPRVEMKVSRSGKSLPIAEAANFQAGDRIWIHPDFPESQSVKYLMIVAFLRGSTNPPPEEWFTRAETWNKKVRDEGIVVTVPKDAQQVLVFLAPDTGGGFATLRKAVRAVPGVFVRASQDLNQAGLYRSRLEKYLSEIRQTSDTEPAALHERSVQMAKTLQIKIDQQCFDRPVEQQAACLTQNTDRLVLDDGHSQSVVAALTTGPSSDLIGAISTTPVAGGGFYSAYIGAVVDLARLLGNIHTAEFQYIPALAMPNGEQLNLHLNNPPSFRNPKSVIVVGLPAVEAPQLPPLRNPNAEQVFCLQNPGLVLPVEGAPLVFSTAIAHDFVLGMTSKSGAEIELPAKADAVRGGFVVDTEKAPAADLETQIVATLRGKWGFEAFAGPSFHIRNTQRGDWTVPQKDQTALIVGRDDTLHLESICAVCAEKILLRAPNGKETKLTWKASGTNEIEVHVPLKDAPAGKVDLLVHRYGQAHPDELSLQTYSEAAKLEDFTISAGDQQGVLEGTRLDEVNSFELNGVHFAPAKLTRAERKDVLYLAAPAAMSTASFQAHQNLLARVALKDGRVLDLQTTVQPARPRVSLMNKSIQLGPTPSAIRLGNNDLLPQGGRITFFVKSEVPEKFSHTEKIEVASEDESFHATLSFGEGNLVMQDAQTALAILDPLKSFGPSAFGVLRFRAVSEEGSKGDWLPLATLVRLPTLKEIRCPDSPDKQCRLSGSNLFLLESVASDQQFAHNVPVPAGFADGSLGVPRPNGTLLYIKLRDDPSTGNMAVLPVLPDDR